ncbi:AAA family ATPase [Sedimenticola selenatireducens]|uniref:AAA family ATPase n=1 Tax=Sedimenticola selenatireducens TaxID=191960 RepID=UPI00048E5884|nr:ATP-binding protein [Sedimenticola selenatireducens]
MASSEQLKALIKSHLSGDDDRFLSVALQVAAHEAKIGHGKLAIELRDLVEKARKSKKLQSVPVSIAKGVKDASGLLYATTPSARLADLVTTRAIEEQLIRVIREQRHLAKLKNHGLEPRRRLLLVGAPGTGKTFTASVLAGELGYPLFQVRLDAVITKFMGESSAKLRQIFDAIREVRGVYFFDEFDALGSQRSSSNDVGEARRILNSFLQMIEQDDSNSVIVCATNHAQMLDYALFRRFDDVIQYHLPGKDDIQRLFNNRLKPYMDNSVPVDKMAVLAEGLSSAEVTQAAQDAIKEMLIHGHEKVTQDDLQSAIEDRRRMSHQVHKQG